MPPTFDRTAYSGLCKNSSISSKLTALLVSFLRRRTTATNLFHSSSISYMVCSANCLAFHCRTSRVHDSRFFFCCARRGTTMSRLRPAIAGTADNSDHSSRAYWVILSHLARPILPNICLILHALIRYDRKQHVNKMHTPIGEGVGEVSALTAQLFGIRRGACHKTP